VRLWPRPKVHFQLNRSVQERAVAEHLAKLLAVARGNTVKQRIADRNIDTEAHSLEYIGNTEVLLVSALYFGTAQWGDIPVRHGIPWLLLFEPSQPTA